MRLTILGSGTSSGVPMIQCHCPVCSSKSEKNKRLRASAWLEMNQKHFLIDTSTDLRQQALKAKIPRVDAVLYTHPHADHLHGIDELRSFNFVQTKIPAYGNHWTCTELLRRFSYIFEPKPTVGGGIPQMELHEFDPEQPTLQVLGEEIIPLPLHHGTQQSVGFRFGSIAYVTDCHEIPPRSLERMKGLSTLVLDCVRIKSHSTHLNLEKALEAVDYLKPKKTYLTHLSHDFDYHKKTLPKGVSFAYDGLVIRNP